jgi:Mg2+ and Co2+ transporter CorA
MVQRLKKVSKGLAKASKLHKQQSNIIKNFIKKNEKKPKKKISKAKKK